MSFGMAWLGPGVTRRVDLDGRLSWLGTDSRPGTVGTGIVALMWCGPGRADLGQLTGSRSGKARLGPGRSDPSSRAGEARAGPDMAGPVVWVGLLRV